jgi:5-methylcytosine-specific restriction endonuclease McrBC regulatory subunit McrC
MINLLLLFLNIFIWVFVKQKGSVFLRFSGLNLLKKMIFEKKSLKNWVILNFCLSRIIIKLEIREFNAITERRLKLAFHRVWTGPAWNEATVIQSIEIKKPQINRAKNLIVGSSSNSNYPPYYSGSSSKLSI